MPPLTLLPRGSYLPREEREKRVQEQPPVTKQEREASLAQLNDWLNQQLRLGSVPRSRDILEHVKRNKIRLRDGEVRKAVRLHPSYHYTSHQQREPRSSRKDRLILTNTLGMLHCDIGYFPVVREYETPKSFQYGFLVARDILSRYTYLELMEGKKSASNLIRVFGRILKHHSKAHPEYPVLSISFDKEPAIKSRAMKRFLDEKHIQRFLFQLSRSKSKMAENAIRLVRSKVERLMVDDSERRWWRLLPVVAQDLNSQEIIIEGKKTGFSPADITPSNLSAFLKKVHKGTPAYYIGQFRIPPPFVKFQFKVGDIVRAKSLLASSQVIGVKRSQVNLEPQTFRIVSLYPFTTKDLRARPGYRCKNTDYGDVEIFAEQDIALSYL